MQHGRRSRTPRIELYWTSNTVGHPRLGVVVPRYGGTAPARNRLRRRLREGARRLLVPGLSGVDLVIKALHSAYAARFAELSEDLGRWLRSRGA